MSSTRRTNLLLVIGALGVLVSGWVHFYLYFRGGYRGIAPESASHVVRTWRCMSSRVDPSTHSTK